MFNLKSISFILGGALLGALFMANYRGDGMVAGQSDNVTLNWGKELAAGRCVKPGKQIINVTQKVANSVDSGTAGNYWAYDNYNRTIQVWGQEGGTYCAVVKYQGKFDAQEGQQSPGNGGVLDGTEDGTFEGGYRGTIAGTLRNTPLWKDSGTIGEVDYKCDIDGNCPGSVNWLGQYFNTGYSFAYDWWGWIYHTGKNGTWVNSVDGNSGDIL